MTVKNARKQKGVVALMFTMTILAVVTIITLFSARVIVTDNKIYNNVENNADALNAAQAGFDYALGYLNAYPYVIIAGLSSCATTSNTFSLAAGSLPNGSIYTMTFSCLPAGGFTSIGLSATGKSADGSAQRTITAMLSQYCNLPIPLITNATAALSNTSIVSNPITNATRTIDSGSTTTLSNTATATTATGGAYSCAVGGTPPATCRNIRSSAFANPPTTTLAALSSADFPVLYLGRTASSFESLATLFDITCTGTQTFSATTTFPAACTNAGTGGSLTGKTLANGASGLNQSLPNGGVIYITMGTNANLTLTSSGTGANAFTLGTPTAPIILVVKLASGNGALIVTVTTSGGGLMTINGNIYVNGPNFTVNCGGNASSSTVVNGYLFSANKLTISSSGAGFTTINGAVAAGNGSGNGGVIVNNDAVINYNPSNISNTYHGYCGGSYAVVPGSWANF